MNGAGILGRSALIVDTKFTLKKDNVSEGQMRKRGQIAQCPSLAYAAGYESEMCRNQWHMRREEMHAESRQVESRQ